MENLRIVAGESVAGGVSCCCCGATGQPWDCLAGKSYCPDCQEALARGEAPPLVARTEKQPCCICGQVGTVRYRTRPLETATLLEMDLCPEHIRALLGRRLGPLAYHQLSRQLQGLHLSAQQVFLLHDAFYDPYGRALHPVGHEEL